MNGRYESDDLEDGHEGPAAAADREISLGTGAMLGIFLALVLVCGAFFGFGYSMGHKAGPVVAPGAAAVGEADAAGVSTVGGMRPMPGSSGVSNAPEVVVKPSAGSAPAPVVKKTSTATPATVEAETPATSAPVAKTMPKPYITAPADGPAQAGASVIPAPSAMPAATAGAAPIYVQISAVSHQEDAQLLMTALTRRGYEATVRHLPQDQLLHVQMGPFTTKKDADAMRQRLSADGYNAILK